MSGWKSEIDPELVGGPSGMNSLTPHDSAPRVQMGNKQVGQAVPIRHPDVNRIQTGMEREFGRYTHGFKMPANGQVRRILHKYHELYGDSTIKDNPTVVVIFQTQEEGKVEFDALELPSYHYMHQTWGFRYKKAAGFSMLSEDSFIPKDTPFLVSPNIADNGDYRMGAELNIALMSTEEGIEDGVMIRRGLLESDKLTTWAYGKASMTYSNGRFPLHTYGEDKGFPDIGDVVREDGILFATRQYDVALGPIQLTPRALREVDKNLDNPVYAPPGARIIDVTVIKGDTSRSQMPTGVDRQLRYYHERAKRFYTSIMAEYHSIQKQFGSDVPMSPRLRELVNNAVFNLNDNNDSRTRIDYSVRSVPVGEWYVEVVYEYPVRPREGSKLTCQHGGKGVITHIRDDEHMPRDAAGNVADLVMNDKGTISRMILGRLIRQYANAAGRAFQQRLIAEIGEFPKDADALSRWPLVYDYHEKAAPDMIPFIDKTIKTDRDRIEYVKDVIRDGIYLIRPHNTVQSAIEMITNLKEYYPATEGPITYFTRGEKEVVTKDPILIGSVYIYTLEQMGEQWTALAAPKFQHYGVPARIGRADRFRAAGRRNPTRATCESTVRLMVNVGAGPGIVELHDQSNNPVVQKEVVRTIQSAENQAQIERVVDRNEFHLGKARPLEMVSHLAYCMGIGYKKEGT